MTFQQAVATPDTIGTDGLENRSQDLFCRLQALLDASIDVLILTDARQHIVEINPAAEQVLGYTREELRGRPVEQIAAPDSRGSLHRLFLETPAHRNGTGAAPLQLLVLTRDGKTLPVEAAAAKARLGKTCRWALVLHDLSHRRNLEKEILVTETLQRRQIGEDLHDDVGQLLTGIGLICRKLQGRLEAKGLAEAEDVARIGAFIKDASAKARTLARELVPTSLQATELPSALQELAARTEYLFDVHCRLDLDALPPGLDHDGASHLYRIAQEACHNAIKHGNARRITIRLVNANAALALSVIDDGGGCTFTAAEGDGLGLRLMRHRASLIGATLAFDTNDRGGVTVTCTLPLPAQPDPSTLAVNHHVQPGS